ncbi:MAG TPA: CAP domain-containing protein [Jiangellaceae bacterium]|nr:CAP domain-containing protein [Jiangellaceae bacterium]
MANEVIVLTNAERQKAGCPPVANNRTLRNVATAHSEDMAERNYFSHTSPEGETPADRAEAAGYDGYGGENIALGYSSADAVMKGWMASSGHRDNILNCSFTEIGVGVADSSRGLYWTQMFGRG